MSTEPAKVADGEAMGLEATAEEIIALYGGDPRKAVEALLVANQECERELRLTQPAVSYGFSRGWHHKRNA